MGLRVPTPRARRFCGSRLQEIGHVRKLSLDPHLPRSVPRHSESEQPERSCVLGLLNTRDYILTQPRLSVTPRCGSRHPDTCDTVPL